MRMKAPAPDQWDIPTSRPRRTKAKGRQIDGIAYKGTRLTDVFVEIDSCKQIIGGDHERISTSLLLREGDRPPPHRVPTGPRVVIKQPPKNSGDEPADTTATRIQLHRTQTKLQI